MNFFFGYAFWGILILLWGLSLLLKSFGISIPLARIFFAVILILFGLKLLFSPSTKISFAKSRHSTIHYSSARTGEYNIIFSSGTIDLREMKFGDPDVEITVVFGSAKVLLPEDLPIVIEPTTVFGRTVCPKHNEIGITHGRREYNEDGSKPILIESNCVFGDIEYLFAKPAVIKVNEAEEVVNEAESGEF